MTDRLSDTESWIRTTALDRRAVLGGGVVASAYALAVQPVSAATIATPAAGLDAGMVTFTATGGTRMAAYRARPAGKRNAPVILVVQEIFGLHEWIRDICRRLAKAGYYAIAPDLFARAGDATKVADIPTLFRTIVAPTPDVQVMTDLDALLVFAKTDGGNTARAGITGFCWGGRVTWLYAAHNPSIKAGVAWYGRLAGAATPQQPRHPIDLAASVRAPVLGLYGAKDGGIPVADVERMRAALVAAKKSSTLKVFATADHGFLADYRPSYDPAAARQGWNDALTWFARYLR